MKVTPHNNTKYLFLIAGLLIVMTFCEKPQREVQVLTIGPVDSLISYYTAKLKGELTDLGSNPVEDHGIYLSTNNTPDNTNSTVKSLGPINSKGQFVTQYSGLAKNTLYYYCAYVSVKGTISSGTIFQFRTKDTQVATVTAGSISEVTLNSAKLAGDVISDGGETVIKRGVCWNTTPNPTISSCLDSTVNGSGTGSFTGLIHGLSPATQYYARAYAINAKGTSYNSSDINFATFNLPTVTTAAISSVTAISAVSGGNVTNEGGAPVTARGVCWSTSSTPTVALPTKTINGTGPGAFTSNITGLANGTTYYVRAYATNQAGTGYGNELSFLAGAAAPAAITSSAIPVGTSTATLNGSVNANNLTTTVTFEYGTTTSYGLTVNAIQNPVTGSSVTPVSATVTGLSPSTTYHFRVKAVSTGGTTYGNDASFITNSALPTVADYDGNPYSIVTIGTQEWLQSDLRTEHFNNGEPVLEVTSTSTWIGVVSSAMCFYNNDKATYKSVYGILYNWYAATDVRNICPVGWHTPSDAEWTTLKNFLGGGSVAGGKLKESGFDHWSSPNIDATNETGFTALPNGYRAYDGGFGYLGGLGYWWTSTAQTSSDAVYNYMSLDHGAVDKLNGSFLYGFGVRCIKGAIPLISASDPMPVTPSSAKLNGKVNPNSSSTVVTFEYGPTASYGFSIQAVQSPVSGNTDVSVNADVSGLTASTIYHFRIKAENAAGIVYSNDQIFKTTECMYCKSVTYENGVIINEGSESLYCGSELNTFLNTPPVVVGSLITRGQCRFNDADGNVYTTLTIDTQIWMKENLKTTKYNDGISIPNITVDGTWTVLTSGAYSDYNNTPANSTTYGRLYNWYSINTGKLCPIGWHIPTDPEWTILTSYLGGENVAGGKLKETGTIHWLSPNAGATNETGFTALPGGYRYNDGVFKSITDLGYWWSSTDNGADYAWNRKLYSGFSLMLRSTAFAEQFVNNGYSVRCIKD